MGMNGESEVQFIDCDMLVCELQAITNFFKGLNIPVQFCDVDCDEVELLPTFPRDRKLILADFLLPGLHIWWGVDLWESVTTLQ